MIYSSQTIREQESVLAFTVCLVLLKLRVQVADKLSELWPLPGTYFWIFFANLAVTQHLPTCVEERVSSLARYVSTHLPKLLRFNQTLVLILQRRTISPDRNMCIRKQVKRNICLKCVWNRKTCFDPIGYTNLFFLSVRPSLWLSVEINLHNGFLDGLSDILLTEKFIQRNVNFLVVHWIMAS